MMSQKTISLILSLLLCVSLGACKSTTTSKKTEIAPASIVQIPNNWKQIAGEGVFLSLPENFEGGNPQTQLDQLEAKLATVDPKYGDRIAVIKQNSKGIALLAFDLQSARSGIITNVNVIKEELPQGTTMEASLAAATSKLGLVYEIVDQKLTYLDDNQVGRIVAEANSEGMRIKPLFYLIPDGNTIWLITYSTTAEEFNQRLPYFEQSIQTFKVES